MKSARLNGWWYLAVFVLGFSVFSPTWPEEITGTEVTSQHPAVDSASAVTSGKTSGTFPEEKSAVVVLTLEDAQAWALRDNPSLAVAEAQVRQAAERVRQAQAAFWPQVGVSAGASRAELSDASVDKARAQAAATGSFATGGGGGASSGFARAQAAARSVAAVAAVPDTSDSYTVALNASYLLFDGFARNYGLAVARLAQKESALGRLEAARLILDAVAQAYYGVQLSRERLRIAEADRAYNQRLLTEARARHEAGAAALSEVLNFEVLARAAEASVIEAERGLAVARIGLAGVMGIEEGVLPGHYEVSPLDDEPREMLETEPDPDALIRQAWNRRPDVSQRAYAVLRAASQVKAARASLFPTLTAFVQRQGNRGEDARFREDDFATTYGVNLSWSIFTGFQRSARIAEARHVLQQNREQERAARISAAQDVREALEAIRAARQQLLLQRDNAAFVARNRELVEAEYMAGQTSLALLNQAQRNLVEAQGNLASARVAVRRAWHQLRTATGETLERFYAADTGKAGDTAESTVEEKSSELEPIPTAVR
ncbi:MAG: TolC family protein [Candidatus Hydrogenedentes bacterium]|nr:TolC family protein [Candidatus Hydrogenedentota bacterium]